MLQENESRERCRSGLDQRILPRDLGTAVAAVAAQKYKRKDRHQVQSAQLVAAMHTGRAAAHNRLAGIKAKKQRIKKAPDNKTYGNSDPDKHYGVWS
jgi:predicted alpha/beta hydrolase family esterase